MGSTGAVPTTIHHQATFLSSLKHSRRLKHNRSNSHLFLLIEAMMSKSKGMYCKLPTQWPWFSLPSLGNQKQNFWMSKFQNFIGKMRHICSDYQLGPKCAFFVSYYQGPYLLMWHYVWMYERLNNIDMRIWPGHHKASERKFDWATIKHPNENFTFMMVKITKRSRN